MNNICNVRALPDCDINNFISPKHTGPRMYISTYFEPRFFKYDNPNLYLQCKFQQNTAELT